LGTDNIGPNLVLHRLMRTEDLLGGWTDPNPATKHALDRKTLFHNEAKT
jgi:hypothetical protein